MSELRQIVLGARVDDAGQLVFAEPIRFRAWTATARGKEVDVTLERRRVRRSNQANNRYWVALVPFAQEVFEQKTGQPFTKDTAHLALKLAFLGHEELVVGGVLVTMPKSTAKLSVGEFSEYCERIEAWIKQEFRVDPALIEAEASL